MWNSRYEDRLAQWCQLRESASLLPLDAALMAVNNWWMAAPISAHYLHWDDRRTWPDPWDLLADNIYCELARALGIVYTLHMIEHPGIKRIQLAQTLNSNDNLVLVNGGKYTLNWAANEVLNICQLETQISKTLDTDEVTKKII